MELDEPIQIKIDFNVPKAGGTEINYAADEPEEPLQIIDAKGFLRTIKPNAKGMDAQIFMPSETSFVSLNERKFVIQILMFGY